MKDKQINLCFTEILISHGALTKKKKMTRDRAGPWTTTTKSCSETAKLQCRQMQSSKHFCFVLFCLGFFFWPNHSAAQKFKIYFPHWHSHSLQLAHSSQKSFRAQFMKMSAIILQMSQQVLGVSFPLSKQRQSAALLSQCSTTISWTYLPGKAFPNVPGMQTDSCLHTPLVDTLVKCLAQP